MRLDHLLSRELCFQQSSSSANRLGSQGWMRTVSHQTATTPEEGAGSAAAAHVRGQGFAFPERRTLPSSSVCDYFDHLWWSSGRIDPAGAICVVGPAHDRRVLHDQARRDARLEDASARPADEGRRPAAIRWRSRSQAVSPSSPNGATPSRLNLDDPPCVGGKWGN